MSFIHPSVLSVLVLSDITNIRASNSLHKDKVLFEYNNS